MNRAVHSATTGEAGIGGIDNGINILLRDVAPDQFELCGADLHECYSITGTNLSFYLFSEESREPC